MSTRETVLITGATGLLGRDALRRLLAAHPSARIIALVRDPGAASTLLSGADGIRVRLVRGDCNADALGVTSAVREELRRSVTHVIHIAADTTFSRSLDEARATNTVGTARLLDLMSSARHDPRFVYVSTAFVAGRRTGIIAEDAGCITSGWVNAYEQSKADAEALVRQSGGRWMILRPSTVVCDDENGAVSQYNAVHRALRLYREGLAAMMPGVADSTIDVVTTDYVGRAIVALAMRPDGDGTTYHLCAGRGALSLADMLDVTFERWSEDSAWRRRAIESPIVADLATYALFERTIEQTADASLKRVTRALSHFIPQLALPKVFDTRNSDAALGFAAPPVASYWTNMLDTLVATRWGTERRAA